MGALQALVTVVGLIGILGLLLLILCRYLGGGGWTWTRTWLTSSREEKMVLTRGGGKTGGQFHPNGFMIRSDSDLNLSGRGSFRRFDKTDQDYQLLRQGSIASIRSQGQQQQSSSIPPQPLRPAPSLPAGVIGQQQQQTHQQNELQQSRRLLEQYSTDSVFTSETAIARPHSIGRAQSYSAASEVVEEVEGEKSMPPPRIPPPPPPNSVSSSSSSHGGGTGGSSGGTPRSLPSFSMTNPFLPFLQASTQFFSQTLQGLQQNLQNNTGPTSNSAAGVPTTAVTATTAGVSQETSTHSYAYEDRQSEQQSPAGYRSTYSSSSTNNGPTPQNSMNPTSTTPAAPVRPTSIHSSTSSTRSGISMGELLFSASPSVTSSSNNPIPQPTNPPCEFFNSSDYSTELRRTTTTAATTNTSNSPTRKDSAGSNPFSPPLTTTAMTSSSTETSADIMNQQDNGFTGTEKNSESSCVTSDLMKDESKSSPATTEITQGTTLESTKTETTTTREERASIFEQIRDLNEMSLSKNAEMEANGGERNFMSRSNVQSSLSSSSSPPVIKPLDSSTTLMSNLSSNRARLNLMKQQARSLELDCSGSKDISTSATTRTTSSSSSSHLPDNRDPLKIINSSSSVISAGITGHYSSFPSSYRNARSFSLRQASTDSIGSESDLGSPDGSLPSLQRAMSCDSVCSDTSVSFGELDQTQLTGHLCVGLEYDSETADLLVNVIEAKEINGLHPDPSTPFDSYVRVYLLPDKTTNMQTRVYRKSLNPIYKEKFMFGLELAELPLRSLVFYMYATDKYSNTLIGEAELKLRDVDVRQLPMTTWLPLTDSGQRGGDFGEIMFSLSYLPTAERLTVVIVKARNLKFPRDNVGDPFVKVYLLQRGKKVSKKKSSTKRGEKNPIFNEAMIFGVPAHALQSIQLRITVADCSDCDGNRAYSVGHVIVGSMTTGKPLSHWNQMLSSLRKPIAMWHSLRK